jgi:hypothetical protein
MIKHLDLKEGMELPYRDPRNAGWFGVIKRVLPRMAGFSGRGWTRYRIHQRGPHGVTEYGVDRTIGEINREYTLPV